jgi:ribose-phosphate pyrophosphokinase
MIVPGPTSQALAATLADELDEPLAAVEYDRFPDGEKLTAAPGFAAAEGDRAVVVASTTTDEAHVRLLQLQDAVREAGASEVVTVVPYMGYARQDKVFEPGHPISARAVARAISTGTDRVVLVTPHETALADFFTVPCEVVDASPLLAEPLPSELTEPLFLAPDEGATDLAVAVRDAYGAGETDYFEKKRLSGSEVEITPSDADVSDRDVVLVDDIVATGSTMAESIGVLNDRGAAGVHVATVHPLLAQNARTKLERAGVEAIYGTDTIERDVSAVSVASLVADAL